jgi:hypothetical protein
MRHLLKEPIPAVITLADRVGNVVREQIAITNAPAPEPIIGAVALVKFSASAIGIADFP